MSAIAARKARLAATSNASRDSSEPIIEESATSVRISTAATPSKRKSKIQETVTKRRSTEKDANIKRKQNSQIYGAPFRQTRQPPSDDISSEEDDSSASSSSSSSINEEYEDSIARKAFLQQTESSEQEAYSIFIPVLSGAFKNWHVDSSIGKEKTTLYVALAAGQALLFFGKALMKVIDGQCNLSGAFITSDHRSVLIFAPQNHPLPVVQAAVNKKGRCAALPQCGFVEDRFAAILKIDSVGGTNIDNVAKACPLVRSGAFSSRFSSSAFNDLQGFHPVLSVADGQTCSQMPSSWQKGLDEMQSTNSPVICFIKGPKRVGKSTFSRTLLNRLLGTRHTSVAFLETDLGQTEFGPPGLVALYLFGSLYANAEYSEDLTIGPSWTSLRHPLKSHFIGDVTPRNAPKTYTAAIADLLNHYMTNLMQKDIPLIVNTQGWIKGLGADLLQELEILVSPTHVYEFASLEDDLSPGLRYTGMLEQVFRLDAISPSLSRDRGLNAVEARMLNLVSYFYSTRLPTSVLYQHLSSVKPQWDFSRSLLQQRPFIVEAELGLPGGIHILSFGAKVDLSHQLMALNSSCVALVDMEPEHKSPALVNGTPSSIWHSSLLKSPPSFARSNCLALAIVRSIDVEKGLIHLLCPLSLQQLQEYPDKTRRQLCLVKGAIEIPIWLSLSFPLIEASQLTHERSAHHTHLEGVPLSSIPYLHFAEASISSSESKDQIIGSEKRKIRRNILRRSQR